MDCASAGILNSEFSCWYLDKCEHCFKGNMSLFPVKFYSLSSGTYFISPLTDCWSNTQQNKNPEATSSSVGHECFQIHPQSRRALEEEQLQKRLWRSIWALDDHPWWIAPKEAASASELSCRHPQQLLRLQFAYGAATWDIWQCIWHSIYSLDNKKQKRREEISTLVAAGRSFWRNCWIFKIFWWDLYGWRTGTWSETLPNEWRENFGGAKTGQEAAVAFVSIFAISQSACN